MLQRHLERVCREAEVTMPVVEDSTTWTILPPGRNGSGPDS
jgi:hypothetical protein